MILIMTGDIFHGINSGSDVFRKVLVMRMVIGHSNFGNIITADLMILMMAGDINCGSDFFLEMMMVIGHSNFGNITTVEWIILIMMGDIFMVLTMAMIFLERWW